MSKVVRRRVIGVATATAAAAVAVGVPAFTAHAETPKANCEVAALAGQVEHKHGVSSVDKTGEYAAGWSYNQDDVKQATLWKGEEPTVIETPDAEEAQLDDVNSAGQAVGQVWTGGERSTFVYADGKMTPLEADGADIEAASISEDGQVAATIVESEERFSPALWSVDEPTTPSPLELPEGVSAAHANHISDSGEVVGVGRADKQRLYRWDSEGKPSDIPVPADDSADDYTINQWEGGWGVGTAMASDGGAVDLQWNPDAAEPAEYTAIELPTAINAAGQVVGTEAEAPMLAGVDGEPTELPLPEGYTVASPSDINADATVIVGTAKNDEENNLLGVKWTCS